MQMVPGRNPVLHTVANPIPPSYFSEDKTKLEQIVGQMMLILQGQDGAGLAAPQVGLSVRIFLINYGGRRLTCINPEIINWSGKMKKGIEGCLSYPGIRVAIIRDKRVKVRYTDLDGHEHSHYMTGWIARIFQHELDHVNGITIEDRVMEQATE